jgi:transcriptional regulator NrdR family protein
MSVEIKSKVVRVIQNPDGTTTREHKTPSEVRFYTREFPVGPFLKVVEHDGVPAENPMYDPDKLIESIYRYVENRIDAKDGAVFVAKRIEASSQTEVKVNEIRDAVGEFLVERGDPEAWLRYMADHAKTDAQVRVTLYQFRDLFPDVWANFVDRIPYARELIGDEA